MIENYEDIVGTESPRLNKETVENTIGSKILKFKEDKLITFERRFRHTTRIAKSRKSKKYDTISIIKVSTQWHFSKKLDY